MIIHHQAQPNGQIKITGFEREDWKEWFRFPVSAKLLKEGKIPLPKGFKPTHYVGMMDAWWFWRAWLVPFVVPILQLSLKWYALARVCYKKGWFKVDEGSVVRLWWPLHMLGINPKPSKPINVQAIVDANVGTMAKLEGVIEKHRCMACSKPKCGHYHCSRCQANMRKRGG